MMVILPLSISFLAFLTHLCPTHQFTLRNTLRIPILLKSYNSGLSGLSEGDLVQAKIEDIGGSISDPSVIFQIGTGSSKFLATLPTKTLSETERLGLQIGTVLNVFVSKIDGEKVEVNLKPTTQSKVSSDSRSNGFGSDSSQPVRSNNNYANRGRPSPNSIQFRNLTPGLKLEGVIISMTPYAAFIDVNVVGQANGNPPKINDSMTSASQVLAVGMKVPVYVKEIDKEKSRFTLTMYSEMDELDEMYAPTETKAPVVQKTQKVIPSVAIPPRSQPSKTVTTTTTTSNNIIDKEALKSKGKYIDMKTLTTGAKLEGVVASIAPYAAFLDVNVYRDASKGSTLKVNGMLHKVDLNEQYRLSSNDTGIKSNSCQTIKKGMNLTVYVKEVFKNSGRFTLTMDSTLDKSKILEIKGKTKEDGRERRRTRRMRRQLDALNIGDTVTAIVQEVVSEGIVVTFTTAGTLNITGILYKSDLPKIYDFPPDLKESFQRQLLEQDFKQGRRVRCSILSKVYPKHRSRSTVPYNVELLFEGFPVVPFPSMNMNTESGEEDQNDSDDVTDNEDDDDDDEEEEDDDDGVEPYTRELYEELRNGNPAGVPIQDFRDWGDIQDMIENQEITEQQLEQAFVDAGVIGKKSMITVEQFQDLIDTIQEIRDGAQDEADEYDNDDDEDVDDLFSHEDNEDSVQSTDKKIPDIRTPPIPMTPALHTNVGESIDEFALEAFDKLRGKKEKVTVKQFKAFSELQELLKSGAVDMSTVDNALEGVGATANGQLDLNQFTVLLQVLFEDSTKNKKSPLDPGTAIAESHVDTTSVTSLNSESSTTKPEDNDVDDDTDDLKMSEEEMEEFTRDIFNLLKGKRKDSVTVKQVKSWDTLKEMIEEGSIDTIALDGLLSKWSTVVGADKIMNYEKFTGFLKELDEATIENFDADETDGLDVEFDEKEFEAYKKELFTELSDPTSGNVSVKNFKECEAVKVMIDDNVVTIKEIDAEITKAGGAVNGQLTYDQYSKVMDFLLNDGADVENTLSIASVTPTTTATPTTTVTPATTVTTAEVAKSPTVDEDDDEDDDDEEVDMTEEELEEFIKEAFDDLRGKRKDTVTVKQVKGWDTLQEMLEDGSIDKSTLEGLLSKWSEAVGGEKVMNYEKFTGFVNELNDLPDDDDDEDNDQAVDSEILPSSDVSNDNDNNNGNDEEDITDEEMEEFIKETFNDLKGKRKDTVTVRVVKGWDSVKEMLEDGSIDKSTLEGLLSKWSEAVGGEKVMNYEKFTGFVKELDEITLDDSNEVEDENDDETFKQEIFEELKDGKGNVSVKKFKANDDVAGIIEDVIVKVQELDAQIVKAGAKVTGQLNYDQYSKVMDFLLSKFNEKYDKNDDDKSKVVETEMISSSDVSDDNNNNDNDDDNEEDISDEDMEQLTKEVFDQLKGKRKDTVTVKQVNGWDSIQEMVDEGAIDKSTLEELLSKWSEAVGGEKVMNYEKFTGFVKELDEITDAAAAAADNDKDDETYKKELFDELKDGKGNVSLKKFKDSEDVAGIIEDGIVTVQELDAQIVKAGAKVNGQLNYDQYSKVMDFLLSKLDELEEEESEDDSELAQDTNDDIDEDEEMEELIKEAFNDLKGKRKDSVTDKQVKGWDSVKEFLDEGAIDNSTLEELLSKWSEVVGGEKVMNYEKFTGFVKELDEITDDTAAADSDKDDETYKQEFFDELKDSKGNLSVKKFKDSEDVKDIIEDGIVTVQELDAEIVKAGAKVNGQLNYDQYSKVIDFVLAKVDELEEEESEDDSKLAQDTNDDIDEDEEMEEFIKEAFNDLKGKRKDSVTVKQVNGWESIQEMLEDGSIDKSTLEGLLSKWSEAVGGEKVMNYEKFTGFVKALEAIIEDSTVDEGEEENKDEENEEDDEVYKQEYFDELRGSDKKLSVQKFKASEEVTEIIKDGVVTMQQIDDAITKAGATMNGQLTYDQFSSVVDFIYTKIEKNESNKSEVVDTEMISSSDVSDDNNNNNNDEDNFSDEEMEEFIKETFDQLKGKRKDSVTVKQVKGWDSVKEMLEDGTIDKSTLEGLLSKWSEAVGGEKVMNYNNFSEFIKELDQITVDNLDEDVPDDVNDKEEVEEEDDEDVEDEAADEEYKQELFDELKDGNGNVSVKKFKVCEDVKGVIEDGIVKVQELDAQIVKAGAKVNGQLNYDQFSTVVDFLLGKTIDYSDQSENIIPTADEVSQPLIEEEEEEEKDVIDTNDNDDDIEDDDDEMTDEEFAQFTREVFDELKGKRKDTVTAKQLNGWENIQDMLEEKSIDKSTLEGLLSKWSEAVGGEKVMNYEKFTGFVKELDEITLENFNKMEAAMEIDDSDDDLVSSGSIPTATEVSKPLAEVNDDEVEEKEEEEEDVPEGISDEELEMFTRETFDTLRGKRKNSITERQLRGWDSLKEMLKNKDLDATTLNDLIKMCSEDRGSERVMDYNQFSTFIKEMDKLTVDDEEDELNDESYKQELFAELRDGKGNVSVKKFRSCEDIQGVIEDGIATMKEIDAQIAKVGATANGQLNYEQFATIVDFLLGKLVDEEEEVGVVADENNINTASTTLKEAIPPVESDDDTYVDSQYTALKHSPQGVTLPDNSGKGFGRPPIPTKAELRAKAKLDAKNAYEEQKKLRIQAAADAANEEGKLVKPSVPVTTTASATTSTNTTSATTTTSTNTPPAVKTATSNTATTIATSTSTPESKSASSGAAAVIDSLTKELYDDLRGKNQKLSLQRFLEWDDIQDMMNNGALKGSSLARALAKAKIDDKAEFITYPQFKAIIDALQDVVVHSNLSLNDNEMDSISLTTSTENQVMGTGGESNIDVEGSDDDETAWDDREFSEEDAAREVYDNLRGDSEKLSLVDFLRWEDVQELLETGALDKDDLATCVENTGVSVDNGELDFDQFHELLNTIEDFIDSDKLPDVDEDGNTIILEKRVKISSVDEVEDTLNSVDEVLSNEDDVKLSYLKGGVVVAEGRSALHAFQEDAEEEFDAQDEDFEQVKEMFAELSQGRQYITLKELRSWDELEGIVNANLSTWEKIDETIAKLNIKNNSKIDFKIFSKFMEVIDSILIDEDGNFIPMP